MDTRKLMLRIAISTILLLSPILLGAALHRIGIQPAGYFLLAIYPQIFLDLYSRVEDISGHMGSWISVVHWLAVIGASVFFARDRGSLFFLFSFILISALSVLIALIAIQYIGFDVIVDTV